MDCRTFHKNLEDYLEGGLDFAGRFAMERHAQQCILCGKELSDAERLRRMVSELERVSAPSNFESSLINEIGRRKLHARISPIRRFRIFGLPQASWVKPALAAFGLVVLGMGILFVYRQPESAPPAAFSPGPEIIEKADMSNEKPIGAASKVSGLPPAEAPVKTEIPKAVEIPQESDPPSLKAVREQGSPEAEYVEYLIMGEDGRPVTIQLPMPRKIRMQYGQMSEEYFIRNVSH